MGSTRGMVTKARILLEKFSHRLRKYFREFTWKARCKVIIEMERTRGIERKDKKKKSEKKKKRMENLKDRTRSEQDLSHGGKKGKALESVGKVQEIVFKWVMEGVNWLGI